jgi:hypothetical protein
MTNLVWLSGAQLERTQTYFPLSHGAPRTDDLRVVSGIVFVITNGLRSFAKLAGRFFPRFPEHCP